MSALWQVSRCMQQRAARASKRCTSSKIPGTTVATAQRAGLNRLQPLELVEFFQRRSFCASGRKDDAQGGAPTRDLKDGLEGTSSTEHLPGGLADEVLPGYAAPKIFVSYQGRNHKIPDGDCNNFSSVQQSVCRTLQLETVDLEYLEEEDDLWVVFDRDVDKDGGLQARKKWILRVYEKEPAAKKRPSDRGHEGFKQALARNCPSDFVQYLNGTFTKTKALKDDLYCVPKPLQEAWGLDQWGKTLNAAYNTMVAQTDTNDRAARVLALINGSGFGKTHALLHAAEAWGKVTSTSHDTIYITYNLEQPLHHDTSTQSSAAFLLRVALAHSGFSNMASGSILQQLPLAEIMCDVNLDVELLPLVVDMLETRLKSDVMHKKLLVLAVDECAKIGDGPVCEVVSVLGKLVNELRKRRHMVLALVSSLTTSPFRTWSNRPVEFVQLPLPPTAQDMVDFVVQKRNVGRLSAFSRETASLMGGCHWRSTMVAVEMLGSQENQTVADLARRLGAPGRLGSNLTDDVLVRIKTYILEEYRSGTKTLLTFPQAQEFANAEGVVPPVLAWMAFSECSPFSCDPLSPIQSFFSNSLNRDPTKQLEHCGIHFDRFKAQYQLPVFPQSVVIHVPRSSKKTSVWYTNLFFSLEASGSAARTSVFDKKGNVAYIPTEFCLCHPEDPNHQYIDRTAVATNQATGEECLVLYQDKLNADLSEALRSLKTAASKIEKFLKKKQTKIVSILCVAQVVSYNRDSTSVKKFPFPIVLIDQKSLRNVYRGTFANAIEYQRQRSGCPQL